MIKEYRYVGAEIDYHKTFFSPLGGKILTGGHKISPP